MGRTGGVVLGGGAGGGVVAFGVSEDVAGGVAAVGVGGVVAAGVVAGGVVDGVEREVDDVGVAVDDGVEAAVGELCS